MGGTRGITGKGQEGRRGRDGGREREKTHAVEFSLGNLVVTIKAKPRAVQSRPSRGSLAWSVRVTPPWAANNTVQLVRAPAMTNDRHPHLSSCQQALGEETSGKPDC
ncbi:hypothetical protein ElyMa_004645500 [Elysia marginata]|uniref:Uncharacterized protein n=1 Tax=Elysia marginata TaxID=1093978 RepID=A0AAV4I0J0_9GAST|nr:hypothetical protein ElyMa_004645500 [Elysia marginata]